MLAFRHPLQLTRSPKKQPSEAVKSLLLLWVIEVVEWILNLSWLTEQD